MSGFLRRLAALTGHEARDDAMPSGGGWRRAAALTDEERCDHAMPGGAGEATSHVALLEHLRRRIERMERRSLLPGGTLPRLPPGSLFTGHRRAPLRLDELEGATRENGVVVVRSRLAPDVRVGKVAPAEAFVASPDVAAPLAGLPTPAPRELLFGMRLLDVETTGLAGGTGTLAFVVGVGRFEGDGTLALEQFVLGAPAEEPQMLAGLLGALEGATLLVTFNGRAFDVPLLRTRCVLARRPPGRLATAAHLDLLPTARRLWRHRASDCRLLTLEERVLGRRRVEDLPGTMAPSAYASFLASGDAAALRPVVEHNRDDLAGMAALLAAALRTLEDPWTWAEDGSEMCAVAEHRLRLGDAKSAEALLERALDLARSPETGRRALTQLARLHRRCGRTDAARRVWERYRELFPSENLGYVELAKHFEHRARDPAAALAVVSQAPHPATRDVERRIARLRRRVAASR